MKPKPVQLTIDDARRPTGHGGWRPGAGRKPGRGTVPHVTRPSFSRHHPQLVTLRIVAGLPSLRSYYPWRVIVDAIAESQRDDFRVIEFSILSNHLHLIIEAESAEALARGISAFQIRVARRLNKLFGRCGKVFASRYHNRPLRTPREVRNALRYVLRNQAHHADHRFYGVDFYSSGAWFDGWRSPFIPREPWQRELVAMTPPTVRATVWLLTTGWKQHDLIGFDEVPGRSQLERRSLISGTNSNVAISRRTRKPQRPEPQLQLLAAC
jgi:REP element-mobilizing transposase RayT